MCCTYCKTLFRLDIYPVYQQRHTGKTECIFQHPVLQCERINDDASIQYSVAYIIMDTKTAYVRHHFAYLAASKAEGKITPKSDVIAHILFVSKPNNEYTCKLANVLYV